jgi:predicted RNA-binding protein with PIN domain
MLLWEVILDQILRLFREGVVRYLIDGYNLLHAMGVLGGKVGPRGLERARAALLGRLCGDHGENTDSVTVVFDAADAPRDAVAEEEYRGLHIRYALDGEADDVIEKLIQQDAAPRQLTVVSDDRRLKQAGRRRRCSVLGCQDYLDSMEKRRRSKPSASKANPKPEGMSDEEARHWLREFADLVNDPQVREALGPDFRDEDENDPPGR